MASPDVLETVGLLFMHRGFKVEVVNSPARAMESRQTSEFGLLIMDLNYTRDTTSGEEGLDLLAKVRAIIAKPGLLLADESTGNLHSDQGREIMELFGRLNSEGSTIVQATHSETNAVYGNRSIRMRDGWTEK